ncbi:MAG: hypothetical protein MGU50_26090 [Trichodesmium sp. MAG_R02]|jgi:uncharacterized protein (DUF885 family)|nr:hypothetical protein [Trichodesmium sp. MAG_R02]
MTNNIRPFEEGKVLIKLKNSGNYTLQEKSSLFEKLNVKVVSTIEMFGIEFVELPETGENALSVPKFIEKYSKRFVTCDRLTIFIQKPIVIQVK